MPLGEELENLWNYPFWCEESKFISFIGCLEVIKFNSDSAGAS